MAVFDAIENGRPLAGEEGRPDLRFGQQPRPARLKRFPPAAAFGALLEVGTRCR
jgi:hypothetical protein